MNKYESIIIINPSVDEEGIKSLIKKFTDIINNEGKVESVEELGKKRLAYEIKKNKEGYYTLERNYRIEDNVMKFITVKKED